MNKLERIKAVAVLTKKYVKLVDGFNKDFNLKGKEIDVLRTNSYMDYYNKFLELNPGEKYEIENEPELASEHISAINNSFRKTAISRKLDELEIELNKIKNEINNLFNWTVKYVSRPEYTFNLKGVPTNYDEMLKFDVDYILVLNKSDYNKQELLVEELFNFLVKFSKEGVDLYSLLEIYELGKYRTQQSDKISTFIREVYNDKIDDELKEVAIRQTAAGHKFFSC